MVQHMRNTLPSQSIAALIESGQIARADGRGVDGVQVQPSSLDLTLDVEAYQLPGSLLPLRSEPVRDVIKQLARRRLDLSQPQLLDRGKVYLIRLAEKVALPAGLSAYTNNKSSTGRIDLATRVVCDFTPRYDKIPAGYEGELWLEVIPKSFDCIVRAGQSLNQAIFYRDRHILRTAELNALMQDSPLLFQPDGQPCQRDEIVVEDGLLMTLDLSLDICGYVARKTWKGIDLAQIGGHDAREYFDPIHSPTDGHLWLERGRFYIFCTSEYIRVPPQYAVEMLPYDTSAGEFRAHYAGFFDPGFGFGLNGEEQGTPAVLEVRAYEDDLIVRHRQPICRMAYEMLDAQPDRLYHASMGSNYATQRGPRLSKFFR